MKHSLKSSLRLILQLFVTVVLVMALVLIINAFIGKLNRRAPGSVSLTPYLSHAEELYQGQNFQELSDYLDKNRLYQADFDKYWEILRIRRKIVLMKKLQSDPAQGSQTLYQQILDQLTEDFPSFDPENQSLAKPWLQPFR